MKALNARLGNLPSLVALVTLCVFWCSPPPARADLADALNATNLTWKTSGTNLWFPQTIHTHDGVAAAQAELPNNGLPPVLETTVDGPGTLQFWWSLSAQRTTDWLALSIDGVEHERVAEWVPWRRVTVYLSPGRHTIAWSLFKTFSSWSPPMGWLDEVSFNAEPTAAFIISGPTNQVVAPLGTVTFAAKAGGTPPLAYQWLFNGVEMPGANSSQLTISNVNQQDLGFYSVVVTNSYGRDVSAPARLQQHNVYAWGAGTSNVYSPPHYRQSVVPKLTAKSIAAGGYHSMALQPNGRVAAWGYDYTLTTVPATLSNVTAIAAGLRHNLAVEADGTAYGWGYDPYGMLPVPAAATNLANVSAGFFHSVALRRDGTVLAWGAGKGGPNEWFSPHFGQSIVPPGLSNIIAVAAGAYHSMSLDRDGSVRAWGLNASGQTNVPPLLSNVLAIAAGASNSFALRADGTVAAWGDNTFGQTNVPPGLSNVVAISAGFKHALALRGDGTLVAWGDGSLGQTNVPANLTNVVAISAGGYHNLCIVNVGNVDILKHPGNQVIVQGQPFRLEIAALGANPLSYQWLADGVPMPGATNATLNIPAAQFTDSGAYHAIVSNAFGAVTSSIANVAIVDTFPTLSKQPIAQFVPINSNAVFTAHATGLPPIHYQWRFNNMPIPGQTNATLIIKSAQLTNEGFYSVRATNILGMTTSSNAFLDVIDLAQALDATNLVWTTSGSAPWFPQSAFTHDGIAAASSAPRSSQTGYLTTTVQGPGTVTFWWLGSDNPRSAIIFYFTIDTTNEFSLNPPNSAWRQARYYVGAGGHTLQWDTLGWYAGGWPGAVSLDEVSFVPGPALAFSGVAPASTTNGAGSDVTLRALAEGTPPLSFQWYRDGALLPGARSATLTLSNVQPSHVGTYSVMVTNDFGWTNASAYLAVTSAAPWMRIQPAHKEMVPGGTVVFETEGRGSEPLSYQWQFNGQDIPGATSSTLTLGNIRTNDAGLYRVRVENALGTAVSSNAVLALARTVIVGWGSVFTSSPNPPLGHTNIVAIAGGNDFSAALNTDGTVFAWGWDAFGKLDVPAGLSNVVALGAGRHYGSALLEGGTLVNWGDSFFSPAAVVPTGLSNIVDIAVGDDFELALRRDGTVAAWGRHYSGQTNVPAGLNNVVDVAAGSTHGVALLRDGQMLAWGSTGMAPTSAPPRLNDVVAIEAGDYYSLALKGDGTVAAWGRAFNDVTNPPPSLTNVAAIAAGALHALALREDGTVVAWGNNGSGQASVPAWLTNVVAISAGATHSLALLNDGSPYITRQPWTQTIPAGADATFAVRALGIPPFQYQWRFNGEDLAHATNAVLTVSQAGMSAAGQYQCLVSNALGTATSLPAFLTVLPTPRLTASISGVSTNGPFTMRLSGFSGPGDIIIYASTNLIDWRPILTNRPTGGDIFFMDGASRSMPARFYRAEQQ